MSEDSNASETIAHMSGKWRGEIQTMEAQKGPVVEVEVGKNSLKVLQSDAQPKTVVEETGGWLWVEDFLIFDAAPSYYIRQASKEKLVFGKLKSANQIGPIDWQTELYPLNE